MKKILFIGDLRSANNYGAIATTDTLINSICAKIDCNSIKFIGYKSLRLPTPPNGWKKTNQISIKNKLRDLSPSFIKRIWAKKDHYKRIDFVPFLFSQYESYAKSMVGGDIMQYEKKMIENSDIIYINGEGNIVNGTDRYGKYRIGGLYILFVAWVAKVKFSKTVCLVNHTVDPANMDVWEIINNVYPQLDYVYVRERLSVAKLHEQGIFNIKFVPDALFSYTPQKEWKPSKQLSKVIDFTRPYICIGDSSGIKNVYNKVKWDVVDVMSELISKLKKVIPQVIFIDGYNGGNEDVNQIIKKLDLGCIRLQNTTYHDLYQILKEASIFISGRWHASILAVLSGTPILLWGSDSHKTRSLYELLNYSYPFFEVNTLPIHIDEIISSSIEIINNKERINKELLEHVKVLADLSKENTELLFELYEK